MMHQIVEGRKAGAYSVHGREQKCVHNLARRPGIDGIMLNCILKK
jgi:hypothetical protein